eukprot:5181734-Prymnesium_polylepis.1
MSRARDVPIRPGKQAPQHRRRRPIDRTPGGLRRSWRHEHLAQWRLASAIVEGAAAKAVNLEDSHGREPFRGDAQDY